MLAIVTGIGARARLITTRLLAQFGLREDSFLLVPAVIIGIITALAAKGFHALIEGIRHALYEQVGPDFLYGRGMLLLILFPALGGLAVGVLSRYVFRAREGHGIIDVIESVVRTQGFTRPLSAFEKIITSAITMGSGGSCGAEGPIVQIGAAISSGVGQMFRFARHQMPIIIGCGSAAGISAIFNAPIGGVLFTLEVILLDFSIRTFSPLVVASVIANVTMRAVSEQLGSEYPAIFAIPAQMGASTAPAIDWMQIGNFVFLGLICGLAGVSLTKLLGSFEDRFAKLKSLGPIRPALGGAAVGCLGILYVIIFGWLLLDVSKPFAFEQYSMPAFFSDGYGVIHALLGPDFYQHWPVTKLLLLLGFLSLVKILATCLTLSSGGSGGVIAPSLFIGATAGGFLGLLLRQTGWFETIRPEIYTLVGMGAVLAAVVHAPLASIIILFELTNDYRVTLPAMLATVTAVGTARLIFPDSVYTHSLRHRGIRLGTASGLMHRMTVEQVELEPASAIQTSDPAQRVLDLIGQLGSVSFVVNDASGNYRGMVVSDEINLALMEREAIPLMVVEELMRTDVPMVKNTDDFATAFDRFSRCHLSHLPVCLASNPRRVIGMLSRSTLMKSYQEATQS